MKYPKLSYIEPKKVYFFDKDTLKFLFSKKDSKDAATLLGFSISAISVYIKKKLPARQYRLSYDEVLHESVNTKVF